jgi:MYXO-CTERM domain-containing protein
MRLIGALLLLPSLASADSIRRIDPAGSAPDYGFVAEAMPGADVVLARQVLPASGAPAGAVAQSRVIYLNHTGALLRPGDNDSRTNYSSIVSQQTQIPAWNTNAQTWADTVSCFRDLFSRFDVQVVDQDPGNVPHIEAIFGGTPTQVGLPSNVGGVSPFTTDCSIIENSIVFTFTDAIPNITSREACEIMAQEVAHSYGLDHELLASDPMTYLQYNGNRAFQDQTASCGEYQQRQCGINGSVCRANQNSVQLLLARVGQAGDSVAPVLSWSTPEDGAVVAPGFTVQASGTDNVAVTAATLYIDGTSAGSQMGPGPYTFTTPTQLADGQHLIRVEITDGRNVQSEMRSVTVQAGTQDPGQDPGSSDPNNPNNPNPGSSSNDLTGGCSTSGGSAGLALVVGLVGLVARRRRR